MSYQPEKRDVRRIFETGQRWGRGEVQQQYRHDMRMARIAKFREWSFVFLSGIGCCLLFLYLTGRLAV